MNDSVCPSCGEGLSRKGVSWMGANYCRGLYLLGVIAQRPGLSGSELSQETGVPYQAVVTGLTKIRDFGELVIAEAEERSQGGVRYRYFPLASGGRLHEYEDAARNAESARMERKR